VTAPTQTASNQLTWLANGEVNEARELSVARFTIAANTTTELHQHPDCEEVVSVLEGVVSCERGGPWTLHRAGEAIVVSRGVIHRLRTEAEPALVLLAYSSPARTYVRVG
jgi:quercetin dioxygenase-like cupin family protein